VRAIERTEDGLVHLDVVGPEGPTRCSVRVEREDVPAPTPLTCKGRDGMRYPAFRVLDMTIEAPRP